MKKSLLLCMAIALTGIFGVLYAQDRSNLSDKALSAQYKHEIGVLNSEIKTARIRLNADKGNPDLRLDLEQKQIMLKEVRGKKQVIDAAIKTRESSEKAARKAEKATAKAERASHKAVKAQQKAEKAQRKADRTLR